MVSEREALGSLRCDTITRHMHIGNMGTREASSFRSDSIARLRFAWPGIYLLGSNSP